MDDRRSQVDPRSPVQPARDALAYLPLAFVAAAAVWFAQQEWGQSSTTGQRSQATTQSDARGCEGSASPLNGSLAGLFTAEDYPVESLDHNEQGTVQVRVEVNGLGSVDRCTIVQTSGHPRLDRATCAIISRRARFSPAHDQCGAGRESSLTQKITWQIAD